MLPQGYFQEGGSLNIITGNTSSRFAESITFTSSSQWDTPGGTEMKLERKKGISPVLYFKYVKSKFGFLERQRMDRRLGKLQKALEEADKSGQVALAEEYLALLLRETRETEMYAKGFRIFIEKEHLGRFQQAVDDNGVLITPLRQFTRPIPKDVLKRKGQADEAKLFDAYVIVHYDPKKKAVSKTEKDKEIERKKDPIMFGVIRESERFYFIGDWEDELCDLTLDDIVDRMKLDDDAITIQKNPDLGLPQ